MPVAKKTAAPGKAVAKVAAAPAPAAKAAPAALVEMDEEAAMMLEDSVGDGMEDFGKDDLSLPFLRVLQALSPQVTRGEEKYIKGAKAGMFLETLSGTLHHGEAQDEDGEANHILFIPSFYCMSYTEWKPRDSDGGGGFVKDHGSNPAILGKTQRSEGKFKDVLANGNEILTSAMYYGLLVDEETGEATQVLLPLSSTQLKKSKRWNSQIASLTIPSPSQQGKRIRPPLFYTAWKLSTIPESNDKGNWFGLKIEPGPAVLAMENGKDLFIAAKAFREMVSSGNVKVKHEAIRDNDAPASGDNVEEAELVDDENEKDLPF